ncbi:MAG TPA: hypothetical protein VH166_05250 [Mycobacterium sp.]|jgi:hypothetical protein|nr:hypothetical protein [Mycobacterium sp.]
MIDLKRIAAGATIAGALSLTGLGLGTGVANAAPITAETLLPQGHGDDWHHGGRGFRGHDGDWNRGYYNGPGYGYGYGAPWCVISVAGVCV